MNTALAIIGTLVASLTMAGAVLFAAFRIGRSYGAIERAAASMQEILAELKIVRERLAELDALKSVQAQTQSLVASLAESIAKLFDRVTVLETEGRVRERMTSRPNLDGE